MICNFNRQDEIVDALYRTVSGVASLKDFDAFINFLYNRDVFENDLEYEAEVLIVSAIEFNGRNAIDPDLYKISSDNIYKIMDLADKHEDDLEGFIKNVRALYGKKYQSPEQLLKTELENLRLKAFSSKDIVTKEDFDKVIDALRSTVLTMKIENPVVAHDERKVVFDYYKNEIENILEAKSFYEDFRRDLKDIKVPIVENNKVTYTNFQDVKEIFSQMGAVIAVLKDGASIVGTNVKNGVNIYNSDGSFARFISNSYIDNIIPITSLYPSGLNKIQFPLTDSLIFSGLDFNIQNLDDKSKAIISSFVSNPALMSSSITVTAQKGMNTEGLMNHVNFEKEINITGSIPLETEEQSNILKNNEGTIVSTSLPTESDFFYRVTINETGASFFIRTLEDLVKLSSNNSSSKLIPILSRPEAIITILFENRNLLGKKVRISNPDGTFVEQNEPLNTQDFINLTSGINRLSAFKKRVETKATNVENISKNTFDVTEDFLNIFQLSVNPVVKKIGLTEYVSKRTKSVFNFKVATIDPKTGTILKTETRSLPLIYKRIGVGDASEFKPILQIDAKNERIIGVDGKQYGFSQYIEQVLGIRPQAFNPSNTSAGFIVESSEKELTPENITTAKFNRRDLNRINSSESIVIMAAFVNELNRYISVANTKSDPKERNQIMRDFANNKMNLQFYPGNKPNPHNNSLPLGPLYTNISLDLNGVPQLEFRGNTQAVGDEGVSFFADKIEKINAATDEERKAGSIKGRTNFKFPQDLWEQLTELFSIENPTIKSLPEIAFHGVNMKDRDEVFKRIELLRSRNQYKEILDPYFAQITAVNHRLGNFIQSSFEKTIQNIIDAANSAKRKQILDHEFPSKKGVMTNYVDTPFGIQHVPLIHPRGDYNSYYYDNINNFYVLERELPASIDMVVDTYQVLTEALKFKEDGTLVKTSSTENKTSTPDSTTPSKEIKIRKGRRGASGGNILSLSGQTVDQSIIDEQISYIQRLLPQFKIEEADLSEMFDNISNDSQAFGAFVDKVLFLDKNLRGSGVVYHEAFHGVYRHLFDNPTRRTITDAVINDKAYSKFFTESYIKEFSRKRGVPVDSNIKDLIAEEILADEFQKYTLKRSKYKGLWAKLFDLLMRLINMFSKNKGYINKQFRRINNGYFTKSQIESNLYDGQVAYALVTGTVSMNNEQALAYKNDKPFNIDVKTLGASTQKRLVTALATEFINNGYNQNLSFDENFERIAEKLAKQYDIQNLINKAPDKERAIVKKYGELYHNFRFILTAGKPEQPRNIFVGTLDEEAFSDIINNPPLIDSEITGIESLNTIKEQVKSLVKSFKMKSIESLVEDTIDEMRAEGQEVNEADIIENADTMEEIESELPDLFESTLYGINVLTSMSAEFKKFFGTISFTEVDPELGIEVPSSIDGTWAFNAFLKMAADVDPDKILPTIALKIDKLRYDNKMSEYNRISKVFNEFLKVANVKEENGNFIHLSGAGSKFYNEFIEIFHVTSTNSVSVRSNIRGEQIRYSTLDSVISSDARSKVNQFFSNLVPNIRDIKKDLADQIKETSTDYVSEAEAIKQASKIYAKQVSLKYLDIDSRITKSSKTSYLFPQDVSEDYANEMIERVTEIIESSLNAVGLTVPKSFIRFSLIALDHFQNGNNLYNYRNTDGYKDFIAHYEDASKGRYISKKLFSELGKKVFSPLSSGKSEESVYSQINNYSDKTNAQIQLGFRKAFLHLSERDVFDLQSMTLDTENKPRYRYSKYTPFKIITNSIKRLGLLNHFKTTEYYSDYMKAWYNDHPIVQILNGPDSAEKKEIELILKNLDISTNMGIDFFEGKKNVDGKTFKNLDPQSHYLLDIMHFVKATRVYEIDDDTRIFAKVYKRSLGQLEGSRTNFLINSPLNNYINKAGFRVDRKIATSKNRSIVGDLFPYVKQEYNRIARESAFRELRLERHTRTDDALNKFIEGDKNLIKDFNARTNEKGEIDNKPRGKNEVQPDALRAFEFGYLGSLFQSQYQTVEQVDAAELNKEEKERIKRTVKFREELREAALKGVPFEEFVKGANDNLLEKVVRDYLDDKLKEYILKLRYNGLIRLAETVYVDGNAQLVDLPDSASLTVMLKNLKPTELFPNKKEEEGNEVVSLIDEESQETVTTTSVSYAAQTITNKFYNDYMNSVVFTQLFDGDFNMSVPDFTNWVKRAKQYIASGQSGKKGIYKAVIVPEIKVYINQNYPFLGEHPAIKDASGRLLQSVRDRIDEALEEGLITDATFNQIVEGFKATPAFDGQSFTSIIHQMVMFDQIGRLDDNEVILNGKRTSLKDLMIQSHYRKLEPVEIDFLKKNKVLFNSKKTVHASSSTYLKHSEHLLLRPDLAEFELKPGQTLEEAYSDLHNIYSQIFHLKNEINEDYEMIKSQDVIETDNILSDARIVEKDQLIKELYNEAQLYFPRPQLGKETLYFLLNQMESENIDYLGDTNVSKRTTLLPEYNNDDTFEDEPLENRSFKMNSIPLEMRYKFSQIETSRIKEKVKASVQHKMLISADKAALIEMMKSNPDFDQSAIDRIDTIMNEYQDSLKEVVKSKRRLFEKIVLDSNGEFDKVRLYNLIRDSLIARNSDPNLIKLFEVKNGEAVYSSYLPKVSEMLKYYYFSAYSKNVTEETTSGDKKFLVSGYGRQLIIAAIDIPEFDVKKGQVIRSEIYNNNKEIYEGKVYTRNPQMTYNAEENVYYAEVIIPKPLFSSKAEEDFWLENISTMFGTRIPTEDKRSMIAFKIVDFIDAVYMNSVIVPQMIHLMSGSDFDIDTLYTQSFNYYEDGNGNFKKFGSAVTDEDKYEEYLFYIKFQQRVEEVLNNRLLEMSEDDIIFDEDFTEALKIFLGPDHVHITPNFIQDVKELKENIKQRWDSRNITKEKYISLVEKTTYVDPEFGVEEVLFDHPEFKKRVSLGKILAKDKRSILRSEDDLKTMMSYARTAMFVANLFKALRELNLPSSFEEFVQEQGYDFVVPARQNKNLQDKINIITNKAVFENLYIKERAESKLFTDIMKVIGRDLKSISSQYDLHTTVAHVESKAASSSAAYALQENPVENPTLSSDSAQIP